MSTVPRPPREELIVEDVARALAEDLGTGDCTAMLIEVGTWLKTHVLCRDAAVLCGRPWFDETFRQLDEEISLQWLLSDGEDIRPDQEICSLDGPARGSLIEGLPPL